MQNFIKISIFGSLIAVFISLLFPIAFSMQARAELAAKSYVDGQWVKKDTTAEAQTYSAANPNVFVYVTE